MKLFEIRWFHRRSHFDEPSSLLRCSPQKQFFAYLAAFFACVYVLYVISVPNGTFTAANLEVSSEADASAYKSEPSPRTVGSTVRHEPARRDSFSPTKDINSDGGVKDQTVLSDEKGKTILLWNSFFGQPDYVPPLWSLCPEYPCHVTSNRSLKADAVLVHLWDVDAADVPKRKSHDQIFALLNVEAPTNSPLLPEGFNDLFNWTITYRLDADIPLIGTVETRYRYWKTLKQDFYANKTKMAAWFVSHCDTASERESLVTELARYGVLTDVFGACGPLKCPPNEANDCYKELSKHYLFYLSFENAICTDYVTEKLFNILNFGEMIPVVLGGADYSRVAPPGSYINVNKFGSVKELALYLQEVANDPQLYNSYHRWR